jgi:hypothetical protein
VCQATHLPPVEHCVGPRELLGAEDAAQREDAVGVEEVALLVVHRCRSSDRSLETNEGSKGPPRPRGGVAPLLMVRISRGGSSVGNRYPSYRSKSPRKTRQFTPETRLNAPGIFIIYASFFFLKFFKFNIQCDHGRDVQPGEFYDLQGCTELQNSHKLPHFL